MNEHTSGDSHGTYTYTLSNENYSYHFDKGVNELFRAAFSEYVPKF